jgi:arylesterase / paraoxonase
MEFGFCFCPNLQPMKMMRLLVPFAMLAITLVGCTAIPRSPMKNVRTIPVGDGTEDLVLDDFGPNPRLLISCDDRRHGNRSNFSGIVSYDLQTQKLDTMTIKEYPSGLAFRPHGIDLQQVSNRLQLYVVCHDDSNGHHWVACFQVIENELFWIRNFYAGELSSPNAVCALPDGSIYVNNDHFERSNNGEAIWKKKVCEIIRFDAEAHQQVAFKGLSYGNGITHRNGYIYAASSRGNAVFRFKIATDGKLTEQTRIAKVKTPDNLRWDGDDLIVACHLRPFAFIRHAKDATKPSPTVVYRIRLGEKKPEALYTDKGKVISAGATGLIWDDKLYVGQVFENWIVEVKK